MKEIQHIHTYKHSLFVSLFVVFFFPFMFIAQVVKTSVLEKNIAIVKNNTLAIEALNTDFIFYPSTSKELQIKAYVEGDMKNESQDWDLKLQEQENYISLLSAIRPKQQVTSQVVISGDVSNEQLVTMLKQRLAPMLQRLQNNPIPKVLQSELNQLNFDFEAYNKIGEAYLKIWEQAFVNHLDESDSKEVKQWSKQMVPNLIRVSKQGNTETVNTNQSDAKAKGGFHLFFSQSVTNVTPLNSNEYIIEIGIPESMSIRLNARHGSLVSKKTLNNIKGNLKYTPFEAYEIGGESELAIDFAPVKINRWKQGKLKVSFSKNVEIETIEDIELQLNSSKMFVKEVTNKAIVNGAFSKLSILNASNSFTKLVFLLTQSDLVLELPNIAYNFAYTGNISRVNYPEEKLQVTSLGDFQSHMLHGFSIDRSNSKELQINAKYSQVFLK